MNSFILKMIGIITMLLDHIGAVLLQPGTVPYFILRSIGRLAFPIFAFLIVEGFFHTRDLKKYMTRLGIFALLSEIPFDLAFNNKVLELGYQNIFFTLFLGLILIHFIHQLENKYRTNPTAYNIFSALVTLLFCIIAVILGTDYDFKGILIIVAFYLFRESKLWMVVSLLLILNMIGGISVLGTLSMVFIGFYNGKKGKDIKYFFYIFYPLHLLLLFLINFLV
ncbi:MAG: hypothetical protein GX288_04430 [Clostridiales bacterium]|nr:hypothetical protein [Clostridiales bacterium]